MRRAAPPFDHTCRVIALIWLLLVPAAGLLPFEHSLIKVDIPQFYLAGRLVWLRQADALYPIPRPESQHHPGLPGDADARPAYAAESRRLQIPARTPQFIGPPPLAVLLAPWAALPLDRALTLWTVMLALAQWGTALVAAALARELLGRRPAIEGLLVLSIALSPRSYAAIVIGNVSSFVGLSLGLFAWWEVRGRSRPAALAAINGMFLKYASLALLPALIVARRWRLLRNMLLALSAATLLSVVVVGFEPWRQWLVEIAPRLGRAYVRPANHSLWSVVAQLRGTEVITPGFRIAMLSSALAVLAAYCGLLVRRRPEELRSSALFLASSAGLLAWLLIWSPISWNGYQVYLMPFWGWVIWEATRSRVGAAAAAIIALSNLPILSVWSRLFGQLPPVLAATPGLWSAAATLMLAMARLWWGLPSGSPQR